MKGAYKARTQRIQVPTRGRDRVTGPRYCSKCGDQLLFVGSGKRRVFEDERYGNKGMNNCWNCFRVSLRMKRDA